MNPALHWHRCGFAVLTGLLLYASFYPINFGFLAWVALVPLLLAVFNAASRKHVLIYSALAGFGFYLPVMQWIRVAHPAMYGTWVALSIYCTGYVALIMLAVRGFLRRRIPVFVSLPVLWTLADYVRAHFPTGFSFLDALGWRMPVGFGWYQLGYSQKDDFAFMQLAEYAGVYGLTFILLMTNAAAAIGLQRWLVPSSRTEPGMPNRLGAILVTIGSLLVALAAHIAFLSSSIDRAEELKNSGHTRLKIALVQTNLPQDVKNARGGDVKLQFLNLGDEAARLKPDLIVWPETSAFFEWADTPDPEDRSALSAAQRKIQGEVAAFASQRFGTNTLIGLSSFADDSTKFNAALLVGAEGARTQRYDKMHLVPFGEYVPLQGTFPWMASFVPYENPNSCEPGKNWTRFRLSKNGEDYRFGVLICYEDSDASLAREAVWRGNQAGEPLDFLVNISNDGWFRGEAEHEEHLSICRFRAIETRRPILRAVNMGITAYIDGDGVVKKMLGTDYRSSKGVSGVVDAEVKIVRGANSTVTLYVRYGDWLPGLCAVATFICTLAAFLRRGEGIRAATG